MNENLLGGYAKATIDGNVFQVDVFAEEDINKILTTNIELGNGEHTITSFQLFDVNDVLLAEDDIPQTFTVDVSFTTELPVELVFVDGTPNTAARVVVTGLDYGFVYTKTQELPNAPGSETVHIKMVALLGIPNDEITYYQNDAQYASAKQPITSIIKCIFSIQHINVKNGDLENLTSTWHMYDWNAEDPLEFDYEKSNNPNDTDYFKIQTYRYLDTVDGMVDVNGAGLDGPWQFTLKGDEDFILNDKGLVEFSYYPDASWESDLNYQFTYKDV